MTSKPLTPRQLQVLQAYAAEGLNMAAAARKLGISSRTVSKTLDAISVKLGVELEEHYGWRPGAYSRVGSESTRSEMIDRARKRGIL